MKIAIGNSRLDKRWKNREMRWEDFLQRVGTTIRTSETVSEYATMSRNKRDGLKDVGGFVGGHLREGKRKNGHVLCRALLTLDADYATPEFWNDLLKSTDFRCCVYSTHKHTPEQPRLRFVIPLAREVSEDEYPALGRMVARDIGGGLDLFDDTTYEPARLMYWPSTPSDGVFVFDHRDGPLLDPDEYLRRYSDWRDASTWPVSTRQSEVVKRTVAQQADPLEKPGVVGAFCRTYSIEEAIGQFLSDVYEPSVMADRYSYIPADSVAGVVIYEDKFAFSHHATDPAHGKLLNAFDLVRVHRFGGLEDVKSNNAMCELAVNDERVNACLLEERRAHARQEFAEGDDWIKGLKRDRGGLILNLLSNIMLILKNDPNLQAIVFNELADGMEIKGEVPWKHPAKFWRDADDAQLISYIDLNYGTFSARNYEIAVTKVADDRSYHPIRAYLDALPAWDGVERVETLLPRYLGAEDSRYTRAVTRKILCAAVARIFNPGTKFDNILVLNGPQGVGKSTLISKLGGDWYSDSLNLSDMNDKTAAEKVQGYWLLEIGELAGMRKADIDKVKAFISRQDDKYRASFGRRVTPHPRQCVFFGTTNSEKGYLRDVTGNRRFWTVKTPGTQGPSGKYPWQLAEADVRQIWAEALTYARAGEKLYLDAELEALAKSEQRDAMEQDEREGFVREYLDRLLPDKWDAMAIHERREYVAFPDGPTQPKGVKVRDTTSNVEIWCECFGKRLEDIKPVDSYAIASIMERIEGWERTGRYKRLKHYGRQRVYERMEQPDPAP